MHTSSPVLALPGSLASQSALVARSPVYPKVTSLVLGDLVAFEREKERLEYRFAFCLAQPALGPTWPELGFF